MYSGEFDQV